MVASILGTFFQPSSALTCWPAHLQYAEMRFGISHCDGDRIARLKCISASTDSVTHFAIFKISLLWRLVRLPEYGSLSKSGIVYSLGRSGLKHFPALINDGDYCPGLEVNSRRVIQRYDESTGGDDAPTFGQQIGQHGKHFEAGWPSTAAPAPTSTTLAILSRPPHRSFFQINILTLAIWHR